MTKSKKILIGVVVAVTVLGAVGYGVWHGWDNGKIGDNPRAPTPQAMEKAVRTQAAYLALTVEAKSPCLNFESGSSQAEVRGIQGVSQNSVPGQYSVTMMLQTNSRNQQARDAQLAQFGYLASQGLLAAADTTITTDDGVDRPAKNFKLTWKGFAESRSQYGGAICLNYGKREFAGIQKIEKTLEKMMVLDVYEVTYKTSVKGVPAWAATEEAKRLFPKLADLTEDSTSKAKVVRTKEGWRSAYEIEAEISLAGKGGDLSQLTSAYMNRMLQQLESKPTISLLEANKLIANYQIGPDRNSNIGVACLPLNIQRGGDEKGAQIARDETEFAVTYYDKGDRKSYEYLSMARMLHILSALEGAGLAEMEILRPTPLAPAKASRRTGSQPAELSKPLGIRFKVSKEVMSAIDISGYGGGCIPVGRTKPEAIAVFDSFDGAQSNLMARATFEQTPEWVSKVAERLPALKIILENGLLMQGSIYRAEGGESGKWKLSRLNFIYPSIYYETIPSHLVPLMPLTAAAAPAKPVKAPALISEIRSAPASAAPQAPAYEPSMPVHGSATAPAAPPLPADIYQPPVQPYKPALPATPKKTSSGLLYPAEGSPVHVISIYEAPLPGGAKRGFQQHPEGIAKVSISDPNATLLLFSYEPVVWHINAPDGVKLKRVVATGYSDQRIVFSGGGKPLVSSSRIDTLAGQSGLESQSFAMPTKSDANSLSKAAEHTQILTGVLPSSFQAANIAPETGFVIYAGTPKFALPVPRAPGATVTTITLHDIYGDRLSDGNKTRRGPSGFRDEIWTNLVYSSGKFVFEGKMRVVGSLTAHASANIGLCFATDKGIDFESRQDVLALGDDEARLYKDGDVIGIAADLDNQVMYFHVNGKWQTGMPGSGAGKKLKKGAEYRACVHNAGTTSSAIARGEKKQSDTTWEINFGQQKFLLSPAGYHPFYGGEALL